MASKAALFKPLALNTGTTLLNRIGLSAMTRTRATIDTNIPTDLFPVYYGQRTTKGSLLVTECTQVNLRGRGYARSPGLYNEAQQQGWAKTAEAVHAKGGILYIQLFHAGRVSHSSLLNGKPPVAPSPIAPAGTIFGLKGDQFPYETPLELTEKEIEQTIKDFARSSRLAVEAGLDGVELHAANGYLIQQFLASKTNKRNDKYGGSLEKRSRFLLELVDACQEATGGRVSVKVSPGITFTDIQESEEEVKELYGFLLNKLAEKRVNYIHFSDNMKFLKSLGAPNVPTFSFDLFKFARDQIKGSDTRLIANGGISIDEAAQLVQSEVVDAVSFASLFLTNPDLVTAVEKGVPLRPPMEDRNLWYGRFTDDSQDHIGYTEYPPLVI